ncbi:MAG: peroxiredoxin [Francisellaceae bacterium]
MTYKIGEMIESLNVPMTSGETFSIEDYRGKKLVLYFYPKDNTPGCTSESKDFSRLYPEFVKNNALVFGVSKDSLKSHQNFKAKYDMPFELIADVDKLICEAFGVLKEKSMFGKKYMGIERSTFVIDENGRLVKHWAKVKVSGHAEEVLDYIKSDQINE